MFDTEETELGLDSVFTEPPRPPSPAPTTVIYKREARDDTQDWSEITIRLVGSHPLWGHYLWNASRAFASYLDTHPELYRDRAVLELGAGGGLPGIVAAKNGARTVVLTDYPDACLIDNLEFNVYNNAPSASKKLQSVQGYIWGHPVGPLLEHLRRDSSATGFDLIIMSDLIFNHSQHDALLRTCEETLLPRTSEGLEPCLLVFYTHHRPHLAHRDMEFFSKAQERGWRCEEVVTQSFPASPMFPEDPGDKEVRATVHGWQLTRRS
ncbi:nicotinamide N-methyltransferase [Daedalea quercina L-15889]|uniref:Protein N-terminal and lysine N-methyltransferase EFM7 n=1 Tax=Daedalea quercina L-15889 TaxID=1314783 RepID=A0A165N5L4_9APHY|nr:nicotinamide N-methyltransferase [Daedalea quercina L-15889]